MLKAGRIIANQAPGANGESPSISAISRQSIAATPLAAALALTLKGAA
jgi:hypothetical protein